MTPTIDTSPAALRALADRVSKICVDSDQPEQFIPLDFSARDGAFVTLRALADEKERAAGPSLDDPEVVVVSRAMLARYTAVREASERRQERAAPQRADVADARERFWYEAGVWRTNYVGTDEAHDDALRAVAERALDALIAAVRAERDALTDEKGRGVTTLPVGGVERMSPMPTVEVLVERFRESLAERDALAAQLATAEADAASSWECIDMARERLAGLLGTAKESIAPMFLAEAINNAVLNAHNNTCQAEKREAGLRTGLQDTAAQLATARADVMAGVRTALGFADSAGTFTPVDIAAYVAHQLTVAGEDAQAVRAQLATAERRLAMATRFLVSECAPWPGDNKMMFSLFIESAEDACHRYTPNLWRTNIPNQHHARHPTLDAAFTAAEAYLAAQGGEEGR